MTTAAFASLYDIPEELMAFRDAIRQIADARIRPRAAAIEGTNEIQRVVISRAMTR
jgi:alkylation response protein AidB-like acyl-CoA dehydrogenase